MKNKDIIDFLEKFAPKEFSESWDNVGLLVGDKNTEISKVLLALDVTDDVIEEAIKKEVKLIIAHHPLIFGSIKNITSDDALGSRIIKLIKNDISVFISHTNLDSTIGGTNDILAKILELENAVVLDPKDDLKKYGLGRVGTLKEDLTFEEFLKKIKAKGIFDYINYSLDNYGMEKKISKVGLCTGSVSKDLIIKAKEVGCDIYVTGDLTYHTAQLSKDIDIGIVDIGHYCSENIVFDSIKDMLNKNFTSVEFLISEVNAQTINSF